MADKGNLNDVPLDKTLGMAVNQAKSDVLNDEMAIGASAAQAGGLTPHTLISAATINATVIKASPGRLYVLSLGNANAAGRTVKFYDKATAPVAGDVPVWRYTIAGSQFSPPPVSWPTGLAFGIGIAYMITVNVADSDNTGITAGDFVLNAAYK